MPASINDEAMINEERRRAWQHKCKLHDEKTARKMKIAATIILVLLATGGTWYLLVK
jgi:hypothetical protein